MSVTFNNDFLKKNIIKGAYPPADQRSKEKREDQGGPTFMTSSKTIYDKFLTKSYF
jgi:hypothetical protein